MEKLPDFQTSHFNFIRFRENPEHEQFTNFKLSDNDNEIYNDF